MSAYVMFYHTARTPLYAGANTHTTRRPDDGIDECLTSVRPARPNRMRRVQLYKSHGLWSKDFTVAVSAAARNNM